MSGFLVQNGKQSFSDANGRPLIGGKVYFFAPGTDTPKDTWQDYAQTVLNTNPVILDARGEASIYGGSAYRQVLRDSSGNLIWDNYLPDIVKLASSIQYTFPDGVVRSVQDLSNTTNNILGAAGVGRSVSVINSVFDLQSANKEVSQSFLLRKFHINGLIGGGEFYWSPSTAKSKHNGWRIIDPDIVWNGSLDTFPSYLNATGGLGFGCFVRILSGAATPEMAGALTDWNGTSGTDATPSIKALLKDTAVNRISGSGGTYWVGSFAANEQRFSISRAIIFDWNWSTFICRCEGSAADVSSSLFFHDDAPADIGRYIVDDIGYSFSIAGRGIQAVTIVSRTKSTRGHTIGPCYIARGQSILTCASMASNNFRISNIRFRGAVTFGSIYYGINLADNGDDFQGSYSGGSVIRSAFVYGVSDVDVLVKADLTIAASASVLISQNIGSRPTENIKVKAHFGEINGPILIATDPSTLGAGVFRNIDLAVTYDVLGSNLDPSSPIVKMGCYDSSNLLVTETQTVTTDNIRISIKPGAGNALLLQPIIIYTPSPNHGRWILDDNFPWEPFGISPVNAAGVFNTPTYFVAGRVLQCVTGNLTNANTKIRIPAKYFLSRRANQEITTVLRIAARNGVGAAFATKLEERIILGYVDASGFLSLNAQTTSASLGYGTPAAAFTVAVSADFKFLEITSTGFTGASSSLTASFSSP